MNYYPMNTGQLIEALEDANHPNNPGPHTIHLQFHTTYHLDDIYQGNSTDPNGETGLPEIRTQIYMVGQGTRIERSGLAPNFRLLRIMTTGALHLEGITLTGGKLVGGAMPGHGCCISNEGTLTILGCKIENNTGVGGIYGVGIINKGSSASLEIKSSIITENVGLNAVAGGIFNEARMVVEDSQFSYNVGQGGGAIVSYNGEAVIKRCSIFGNIASEGAAFRGNRRWLVKGCDIFRNVAGGGNNTGSVLYYEPSGDLSLDIVILNNNRIFENRSSIIAADIDVPGDGTNANRIDARYNWWGGDAGPSFPGNLTGGDSIRYVSGEPTKQVNYLPFLTTDDCIQEAIIQCGLSWAANDLQTTNNPISLRLGEKRVEITDLSINTPVGPMTFTRIYRQDKRHDPEFQFMGLGWMHNHAIWLEFSGSEPSRVALARLPSGGAITLFEHRSGYFEAAAGSAVHMVYINGTTDEYVLVAQNGEQFVFFGDTFRLKKRIWPNGDEWDYIYNGNHELEEVTDGTRSLLFVYDEQFGHSVLQSVEDHDGRNVTFSYVRQRADGQIVQDGGGNSLALLSSVQDVLERDWAYDYYGQSAGQDDTELLDCMVARVSPEIDGETIVLEKLTYLRDCEIDLAAAGDMQNDADWPGIVGNLPTSNEHVVGPEDSPARRVITSGENRGIEGRAWHLVQGKTYTIRAEVYLTSSPANSALKMHVDGISDFDQTTTTRDQWLTMTAVHTPSETLYNRRVQFTSTNAGGATFYIRAVSIIETNPGVSGIEQARGYQGSSGPLLVTSLIFAPHQSITQEITVDRLITHRFDRALYLGRKDPAGNFSYQPSNSRFRPSSHVDANGNTTLLSWNANGSQLEQVEDAAGSVTTLVYQSDGMLFASIDPSGNRTLYTYEDTNNPRQPTLHLVTNGGNKIVNGDMEADGGWGNLGSPSANQRIPGAQVGTFVRYVETDATGKGIEQVEGWELEDGETYAITVRIFPLSGTVRMQVFDVLSFHGDTNGATGRWQTLSVIYTHSGSTENVNIRFLSLGGAAIFCVDELIIRKTSDSAETFIRVDLENDANWDPVGMSVVTRHAGARIGNFARRVVAPENAGIESENWTLVENRTYLILAQIYPVSGVIKMRVPDVSGFEISTTGTGNWEILRLTHKFTGSDVVKNLQFVAFGSAAEFYVGAVYVLDNDLILHWQEFDYDSKGQLLEERRVDPINGTTVFQKTTRSYYTSGNGNGLLQSVTQVDVEDAGNNQSTTYFYDAVGRIIKTQRSSLFGSCEISFTVYDAAGNVVASICDYDPGMEPDPTTAEEAAALYDPDYPDKNRVTTHRYDELGRRVVTTTDAGAPFAQSTLTLYDALDRPWRVIQHYHNPLVSEDPDEYTYTAPGSWVWDEVGERWEDGDNTPISHGERNNRNLIQDTRYNARGLVRLRRDALGQVTLYGYDEADRLVKTIQNATDPDYDNDYDSGDPSLIDYIPDTATADVDIITEQRYDAAGNLIQATDALGVVTLTAYDALNRPVEVVSSASDPDYNPGITHDFSEYDFSDDPDQDLRRVTLYDTLGRTLQTGQLISGTGEAETWLYNRSVYDALGRLRLTIRNYVDQGEDPALWVWDETDLRWEQSDGTPIDHGADNDQNLVNETVYDELGRLRFSRDMRGSRTWFVYDGLGRQVRQITGCTYTEGSPTPEDEAYVGDLADPAADVISESYFDVDGRVVRTARLLHYDAGEDELLWLWTLHGYDSQGRQVKTIQNASDPDYDITSDPDLSEYSASSEPDEDLITETHYDTRGRVYKTVDPVGAVTLFGYDEVGRRVKTVQYVSDPDYDVASDPDLSEYSASSAPDEDLITETVYDLLGRVVRSSDSLGNITLTAYDRAGRQVKTIQNASDPDYDITSDPDLSEYTGDDPDPDQDWITATAYDKGGRVVKTTEPAGNVTLYGYNRAGRQVRLIRNTSDPEYDTTSDPDLSEYTGDDPDPDQDRSSASSYNKGGWLLELVDEGAVVSRYVYDALGRRRRMVLAYLAQGESDPATWLWHAGRARWEQNDGSPIDHGEDSDRNIVADTLYDLAGRVAGQRDVAGLLRLYVYDRLGRRVRLVEAPGEVGQRVSYTCYDKGGRVQRMIHNWLDTGISPDARDEQGEWLFKPAQHGSHNDRDLVTHYEFDLLGRMLSATDPAGNITTSSYFKDGQVDTETDAEGMVTLFRYDGARRRVLVAQGFLDNGEDPALWVWDETNNRYEESDGTPIVHGAENDRNVLVQLSYDKGGRLLGLRDPRGNTTEYEYDRLGRRTKLVNPLSEQWLTQYEELAGGASRVSMTYPGLSSGGSYSVQRDFDRLGRPVEIDYGDADVTPRVVLGYDAAGNRALMREFDSTEQVRRTDYAYDTLRRLAQVDFDTDGDDESDETVTYGYDLAGRRTKLTLPGDLSVSYRYDLWGRVVGLRDWDGQETSFFYDRAGRQVGMLRPGGLSSDYLYNPAGHLLRMRHLAGSSLRGLFEYRVDGRGSRTSVYERLAASTTVTDSYDKDAAEVDYTAGSWTNAGDYKQSGDFDAKMKVDWTGDEGLLTMGTGPDHGIFDIYIGGSLWQSYDGYSADPGERVISVPPGELEIRNRTAKNLHSTGYVIRFRQLEAVEVTYDERTIQYVYDALSRLQQADYNNGAEIFTYGFDVAGNLTNLNGVNRTYDAANRLIHDGTQALTYDANGNLTNDGTSSYTWDRANRLLSMGGHSYAYDGDGRRISQTVSSVVTQYLLDIQPGLSVVLSQTVDDTDTTHYVHGPRGLHAVQEPAGEWTHPVTDGLGSVRGYLAPDGTVLSSVHYSEWGVPSPSIVGPAFTGEPRDANALQHHRARYYAPGLAVWTALDPWEGIPLNAMSLNRYGYVWGNPVNRADASGLCPYMTIEQTRGAIRSLQGIHPRLGAVDGALPDIAAGMVCAAQDAGEYIPQLVTVGQYYAPQLSQVVTIAGASVQVAVAVSGTGAAATAAVVISVASAAILVGIGIYLGLAYPPQSYTPEQLQDMRPPTPPTPSPTGTPGPSQPQPFPQATPAPSVQPQPQPAPTPYPGDVRVDPNPNDPCRDEEHRRLYHYTFSENVPVILATGLRPSLLNPDDPSSDAQWGDGQYFTDLTPEDSSTLTRPQHSYALFRNPRKWGIKGQLRSVSWVQFRINEGSVDWRAPLFGYRFPNRGIYLRWNHSVLPTDDVVTGFGLVSFIRD